MQNIPGILTHFKRKEKSPNALESLFKVYCVIKDFVLLTAYHTYSVFTKGTGDSASGKYSNIKIVQSTVEYYCAKGMRHSWKEVLHKNHDAYLLLNTDTEFYFNYFEKLLDDHFYCLKTYSQDVIDVCLKFITHNQKFFYFRNTFINQFSEKYITIFINKESSQECELGNTNIFFVCRGVFEKIGMLTKGYANVMADFNYTVEAIKKGLLVSIGPNVLGIYARQNTNLHLSFLELSLKCHIRQLNYSIGLYFKPKPLVILRCFSLNFHLAYLIRRLKVPFPVFYYNKLIKNRLIVSGG